MAAPDADAAPVVLVVDDEPAVLGLLERALAEAGYQVHACSSPVLALHVVSQLSAPPAVLVTDLRMAPLDGAQLARLVLEAWPLTRALFVSGYGPGHEYSGLPGPLLAKPFPPDALVRAVAELLAAPVLPRSPPADRAAS